MVSVGLSWLAAISFLSGASTTGHALLLLCSGLVFAVVFRTEANERRVSLNRRYTGKPDPLLLRSGFLLATGVATTAVAGLLSLPWSVAVAAGLAVGVSSFLLLAGRLFSATSQPRIRVPDPAVRGCLQEAELQLLGIERHALLTVDADVGQRLRHIAAEGRVILETLSHRPTDLFRARPHLLRCLRCAEECSGQLRGVEAWFTSPSVKRVCVRNIARIAQHLRRLKPHITRGDIAALYDVRDSTQRSDPAIGLPLGLDDLTDGRLRRAA